MASSDARPVQTGALLLAIAVIAKSLLPITALLLVGLSTGCARPIASSPFADVTIERLKTDPLSWIGRPVEVEGVVDANADGSWRLKENCAAEARSVLVRWDSVPGFSRSDHGSRVRVRGVFHDDNVSAKNETHRIDATYIPSRGSLQNVSILWRLPANLPRCGF